MPLTDGGMSVNSEGRASVGCWPHREAVAAAVPHPAASHSHRLLVKFIFDDAASQLLRFDSRLFSLCFRCQLFNNFAFVLAFLRALQTKIGDGKRDVRLGKLWRFFYDRFQMHAGLFEFSFRNFYGRNLIAYSQISRPG